jgi:hypothetical protein
MDWAAQGKGNRNPVVIVNGKKGLEIIHIKAKAGETVWLDASRSFDFENDELSFRWWNLAEAGSCREKVEIRQPHSSKTGVAVPEKASNTTIHIVCEVSDNGTPALTAYRRVVIDVR